MKPEEIKDNLNKRVRLNSPNITADYILTGAIFRRGEKGFYYQAELQDLKTNRSIMICRLDEVEAIN